MAIGRTYPIKKNAVKAYGYTKPPKKRSSRSGPRYAANGSVTHIAAINGRGAYARTARSRMSGLSSNKRREAARSSLSLAKKQAFARQMRAVKGKHSKNGYRGQIIGRTRAAHVSQLQGPSSSGVKRSVGGSSARARRQHQQRALGRSGPTKFARNPVRVKRTLPGYTTNAQKNQSRRRARPARRGTTKKSATATKESNMARKHRRTKKGAARKPVARRVKRRVKAKASPKRKRRSKARKTTLKANPRRRRRLSRNYGTKKGAKKGWRVRKARYAPTAFRKRSRRKAKAKLKPNRRRRLKRNYGTSAGAKKGWRTRRRSSARKAPRAKRSKRKLSQSKAAKKARAARRAKKRGLKPNRRRVRRNARRATPNRRRRLRSNKRRALSPNRRRRGSRRRLSSNRRHRRNGRRGMFRKNGIMDPIMTVLKTGAIALGGFGAHKVVSNLFTTQILNRIFGSPAVIVSTPTSTTAVAPATSGLGGLNVDPQYQRLAGSFIVAALGVFATTKLVKDQSTRNTLITGMSVSFAHSVASALLAKFAPQYSGLLAGPEDGTAARLSAMYGFRGLGGGTSIMPRYAPINGMGEYFGSGVNGLGEYFDSGVAGLGEYFDSGVAGLGAYQAAAGYGANPDMMEAAAGYGAASMPTNHVDPHGDLDRELNIAEAAAGVGGMGAIQSYEASAGFGSIQSLPSSSTWIPGSSDGQLWAGTRSISNPQSATEMVPAGILQTDGGQGVFG